MCDEKFEINNACVLQSGHKCAENRDTRAEGNEKVDRLKSGKNSRKKDAKPTGNSGENGGKDMGGEKRLEKVRFRVQRLTYQHHQHSCASKGLDCDLRPACSSAY